MSARGGSAFFRFGLAFELGLAAVALAVGWAIGVDPWADFDPTARGLALGALASLPMLPVLLLCDRWPIAPLRRIRDVLDHQVLPHLCDCSIAGLALLSIAAGLGEETLFRGLVQRGLDGWLGPWPALAIASVIFGLLHAVTPFYALLAGLIGLYLGAIYQQSDDLTIPVVAHALYDFVALVYFLRADRPAAIDANPTPPIEEP